MKDRLRQKTLVRAIRDAEVFEAQTLSLQAELLRLQRELEDVKQAFSQAHSADLVEANEQLVLAALQAESVAESASLTLHDLTRASQRDALTNLPNRALLMDRLENAIPSAQRRDTRIALLFIDLDQFKAINDTLGHMVGDEVLRQVARRLETVVRDSDTISRYGGDEFLILLTEVGQASDSAQIAAKILVALNDPCVIGRHSLRLSASIGIALYPEDGEDAATLINRADVAMYRAKRSGGGTFEFHAEQAGLEPAPAPRVGPAPDASRELQTPRHRFVMTAREPRLRDLREANEKLLLAVLNAQELDRRAEEARCRQIRFLEMVANDLRKPLTPIRAAAGLFGRTDPDAPMRARLPAIIRRQVGRMSRLVDELVKVSHVGSDHFMLEMRRIDLNGVLGRAADQCRPALDAKCQRLTLELPADMPAVQGQATRLIRVFSRLIENASAHSAEGSQIGLSAAVLDGTVRVTVSDCGTGIAEDALPGLFDPYRMDSTPRTRKRSRSGMALYAIRDLLEAHGGSVLARSAGPGLGSQFVVTLPAEPPPVAESGT
jgi:diguanylate cyclase (GGDEF)-like protein